MKQYFNGKTALVTGAGWGIGAATALLYATYGARVIVSDTSRKGGKDTVAKIKSRKGDATYIKTDVSSAAACEKLIKKTIEIYGSIDIACNNSAIFHNPEDPADKYTGTFNNKRSLNLAGLYNCMQYEIEAMLKQGGGIIINTSFVMGAIGMSSLGRLINTKYGMTALLRTDLRGYPAPGIYINTIAPAIINSALPEDIVPTEKEERGKSPGVRPGRIEQVAGLVIWLSSGEPHILPTPSQGFN
ncbi:MAG TPA: SDR family NAD(P)-dependent oxidoreductase [Puia sp.]|nr:SDR family NAD(P)-dependent oxidoreductase [Puia sp.]